MSTLSKSVTLHKGDGRIVEVGFFVRNGELWMDLMKCVRGKQPQAIALTRVESIGLAMEILDAYEMCGENRCWRGPQPVPQADPVGPELKSGSGK